MLNLSNDILLIIFSYVGPNTIYLDKGFVIFINKLKKEFLNNPLKIEYQLIEWKKKFKEDYNYRPSMCLKDYKNIDIKGNIYLGYFNKINKIINFSKELEDKIIPVSYMKLSDSPIYKGYVIYWTVNNVICLDTIDRINRYYILWNNY